MIARITGLFERSEKQAVFDAIAVMGKALGSPRRLEIIDLLAQAPRTVEELAGLGEQTIANTSQHLQLLHGAGLVSRSREGTRVRYRLSGPEVCDLWLGLRATSAARLAEVKRAVGAYLGPDIETIDRDELERRLSDGDVVLIDVRPGVEYDAGHIPGAVSLPIDQLDARAGELPDDQEVIAYCRGPFCAYANQAVIALHARGRPARRLEQGPVEWGAAGSTVA